MCWSRRVLPALAADPVEPAPTKFHQKACKGKGRNDKPDIECLSTVSNVLVDLQRKKLVGAVNCVGNWDNSAG